MKVKTNNMQFYFMRGKIEKGEKQYSQKTQQNEIFIQSFSRQLEKIKGTFCEENMQKSIITILKEQQMNRNNQKFIDFDETRFTQHVQNVRKKPCNYYLGQMIKIKPNFVQLKLNRNEINEYKRIDPSQIQESRVVEHIKMRNFRKISIFEPLNLEKPIHISVDQNSVLFKVWQTCCQNFYDEEMFQITDTY